MGYHYNQFIRFIARLLGDSLGGDWEIKPRSKISDFDSVDSHTEPD